MANVVDKQGHHWMEISINWTPLWMRDLGLDKGNGLCYSIQNVTWLPQELKKYSLFKTNFLKDFAALNYLGQFNVWRKKFLNWLHLQGP